MLLTLLEIGIPHSPTSKEKDVTLRHFELISNGGWGDLEEDGKRRRK